MERSVQYVQTFLQIPQGNLFKMLSPGLPWWLSGEESTYQCRRLLFDPWVGKIPWRRKWQPNPVFLPRLGNPTGRGGWRATVPEVAESQTQLSD